MHKRFHPILRLFAHMRAKAFSPWFLPLIFFLSFIDFFVVVIPMDALVVASVLLRKKDWFKVFIVATLGSALGAIALAYVIDLWGEPLVREHLGTWYVGETWTKTTEIISKHGAWGLILIAMTPLPQQVAVALCRFAHVSLSAIFLSIFVGRGLKYFFYAYCAAFAPRLIMRFKSIREETVELTTDEKDASVDASTNAP